MSPWVLFGLLILCVIAVTLWLRLWADIISPGPERHERHGMWDGQD